jgi:hypothetical protein
MQLDDLEWRDTLSVYLAKYALPLHQFCLPTAFLMPRVPASNDSQQSAPFYEASSQWIIIIVFPNSLHSFVNKLGSWLVTDTQKRTPQIRASELRAGERDPQ